MSDFSFCHNESTLFNNYTFIYRNYQFVFAQTLTKSSAADLLYMGNWYFGNITYFLALNNSQSCPPYLIINKWTASYKESAVVKSG